jgi:hypothetical protein
MIVKSGLLILTLMSTSVAGNWPGWRGPTGDGVASDDKAPLKWSVEKDLKWKVKVPRKGHATPVIWEDALFLVTAIEETGERILIRMDRKSGEVVWKKTVLEAPMLLLLLGICFLRGALEGAVEGIGDGEKGGCTGSHRLHPGKTPTRPTREEGLGTGAQLPAQLGINLQNGLPDRCRRITLQGPQGRTA